MQKIALDRKQLQMHLSVRNCRRITEKSFLPSVISRTAYCNGLYSSQSNVHKSKSLLFMALTFTENGTVRTGGEQVCKAFWLSYIYKDHVQIRPIRQFGQMVFDSRMF